MALSAPLPAALAARLEASVEEWPYLESEVLAKNHSCKVCMTCRFFRHHPGANCIPVLACQLHKGLKEPTPGPFRAVLRS